MLYNNPLFEFHPAHYVNNPAVIAKNDKMISINAALTVDLTGQVCADSLGFLFYSGIGGQVLILYVEQPCQRGENQL